MSTFSSTYFLWAKGVCFWGFGRDDGGSDAAALGGVDAGSTNVELDALDDVERGGVVSVEATETNTKDSSLSKGIIFPVKGKISSADSTELDSRAAVAAAA